MNVRRSVQFAEPWARRGRQCRPPFLPSARVLLGLSLVFENSAFGLGDSQIQFVGQVSLEQHLFLAHFPSRHKLNSESSMRIMPYLAPV